MLEILDISKININEFVEKLHNRSFEDIKEMSERVSEIIKNVIENGDIALYQYTKSFDKVQIENLEVLEEEINKAYSNCDENIIRILEESSKNIYAYHELQKKQGYLFTKENGVFMGQRIIPLNSVGVYVPGGTAAYPSSVLMNVIPAKVAGVKNIIMVTPPNKQGGVNPNILVAAKIAGVDKIYKVGGAQAVAALAYGTESISRVDKIVGPGNAYVAEAKRQVYGKVGIDMIAGPSEILIIADETAKGKYIAADLMSQAEHDKMASSILLTTSIEVINETLKELEIQLERLGRQEIIEKSLESYGKIVLCKNIEQCVELANAIASEHVEILTENPMEMLDSIVNAGSIFLGQYTPEPVGDYFGGTNHVLPTCGSAKFSSPLSVEDFTKKSSYLYYSKEALTRDHKKIMRFAEEEGLTAHSNAVGVRFE